MVTTVKDNNTDLHELAFSDLKNWTSEFVNTSSISREQIFHFVNYKDDSIYLITYEKKLYNLKNGILTFVANMGFASNNFAERESSLLCYKDKLYAMNRKQVIEYDILKNIQTKITNIPNEISDSCAFVTDKSLQILGGGYRPRNREVFDFNTKIWTSKSLGYGTNMSPNCTIWDGKLYVKSSEGNVDSYIKVGELEGAEINKVDYKFFLDSVRQGSAGSLLSDNNGLYIAEGTMFYVLATKGIYSSEDTFLY